MSFLMKIVHWSMTNQKVRTDCLCQETLIFRVIFIIIVIYFLSLLIKRDLASITRSSKKLISLISGALNIKLKFFMSKYGNVAKCFEQGSF